MFKKIWKWIKIIGLIIIFIIATVGSIFLVVFFNKKPALNKAYLDKLNNLLQEKKDNEEIITNSDINDYDKHGNYKPRKK